MYAFTPSNNNITADVAAHMASEYNIETQLFPSGKQYHIASTSCFLDFLTHKNLFLFYHCDIGSAVNAYLLERLDMAEPSAPLAGAFHLDFDFGCGADAQLCYAEAASRGNVVAVSYSLQVSRLALCLKSLFEYSCVFNS